MTNPLSTGQIALWYALMYINNKAAWQEWFTAANLTLEAYTGLSRSGINKARNILKQEGLIDFQSNGNRRATSFKICVLYSQESEHIEIGTSNSTHIRNVKETDKEQVRVIQGTVKEQQSGTLNKHKHKQNINESNIYPPTDVGDAKAPSKKSTKTQELESDFEKLWKLYPRKERKADALKAYKKARKAGVTNKEIQNGIVAYTKKLQAEGTSAEYIAQGGTWFNQQRWCDDYTINAPKKQTNRYGRPVYQELQPEWFKSQDDWNQSQETVETMDTEQIKNLQDRIANLSEEGE